MEGKRKRSSRGLAPRGTDLVNLLVLRAGKAVHLELGGMDRRMRFIVVRAIVRVGRLLKGTGAIR